MNRAVQSAFVVGLLIMAVPVFAVEAGQVAYVSGTVATVPPGSLGKLDMSSVETLDFTADAVKPASGGNIRIDYKKISKFDYSREVTHHLGVLPAVAVSLVKRRERKHFFTITYKDSTDAVQVAIFEVSKGDPPGLLAVLRARAPQVCKPYQTRCGEVTDLLNLFAVRRLRETYGLSLRSFSLRIAEVYGDDTVAGHDGVDLFATGEIEAAGLL